jgi:hypothetical protein
MQAEDGYYGLCELLQAAGNITGTLHYYDEMLKV